MFQLPPGDGKETVLVFFKTRPEVVTDENISHIVFVASMPDSPITALYYTILRVFAPTLLKVSLEKLITALNVLK